ncbi:MAG: hypothetical protein ABSH04_06200 [Acidimicrobiales bacterium]
MRGDGKGGDGKGGDGKGGGKFFGTTVLEPPKMRRTSVDRCISIALMAWRATRRSRTAS